MTLVERTAALRARCESLATVDQKIEDARVLGTRLAELRRVAEKLPDSLGAVGMLATAGIAVAAPAASVTQVRSAVAKIRTRFTAGHDADALTKGQDWKVLLRELPKVVAELESSATESWETYAQQLFSGDAPGAIERTLGPTDANKAALLKYRQAYERYVRLKSKMPEKAEDVGELARAAQELQAVKFDYNVSAAVRKFLEALPSGAPLALLTDEVREWIEREGLSRRYQVVVASR